MAFDVWASFLLASIILCFNPGPTIFLVMSHSLSHGTKSVIPLILGVLTGDVIAMGISFAGLGAFLETSAAVFAIFKWVVGAYLVYLGFKALSAKPNFGNTNSVFSKNGKEFKEALIATALNPKGIIFFTVFFPLFININKPVSAQMLTMSVSFIFASGISAFFYSIFSVFLSSKANSQKLQKTFNKVSGSMLIGAGVITATF